MSRTMKGSGIEWIGDVPEEWEVHPFKAYYKTTKGLNITKENLVERGIPVISYGQIHSKLNTGTSICDALIRYVPETYLESNPECLSKKYDIFFADTSEDVEGAGNIAFVDTDTPIFAGYHTIIARPQKEVKTKYFAYLAKTDAWRTQIRNSISGVKVFSISQKLINRVCIIIPPLAEQHLIATFLDKKCSEIDSLIDLQEQMIEELKAYKQSVITEAVTKGLNPNVPMKDSGIEWIGEIPEGWKVCFIKQIMRNKSIKGYPCETVLSLYRDYGVVPKDSRSDNHNVTSEDTSSYKFVEVGDFVINKMKAWQGSMAVSNYQGIISPAYYICRFTTDSVDREYVHYLLRNETYKVEYMRLSSGLRIGQWDLNIDDFLRVKMVLPSLAEQQAIADYLDRKCGEIDELITIKQQKIESLKEYKKSVIYEYVTGKREV